MNAASQTGAVLMDITDTFDRNPVKPADMDTGFYDSAIAALQYALLGYGLTDIESYIELLVHNDEIVFALSHRQWLLSARAAKVGMGYSSGYTVLQMNDTSRSPELDYEYIAWPSDGSFPTAFLAEDDYWTVSLNPDVFANPVSAEISISIERISDGELWTIDENSSGTGEYFDVGIGGYSPTPTLIFRFDDAPGYDAGESFSVHISGLKYSDDSDASLNYDVVLFDLK
jgi:hypothetical protein